MRPFALAILLVAAASPAMAQGNQQITAYSDASYPQEWRLLHDYWFDSTTYLNDARSFHVRMSVPSAGTYVWSMPAQGGIQPDLPNPLASLFSEFRIQLEGTSTTWDLAAANTTTPFSADGIHDLQFTFSYRIATLSPYEYTTILEETRLVREAERAQWPDGNIVSRPNEASGFIHLQQVTSDREPDACPSGTCADITHLAGRDFNLVFRLIGMPFELLFHQAGEVPVSRTPNGSLAAQGSSYTSNAAFEATLEASGNLTKNGLAVALDAPTGRVVAHLDGGHPVARVTLPAGNHRFYYVFESSDPTSGSVHVGSPRSSTYILDSVVYDGTSESPSPWWLALALPLLMAAALAARRRRYTWFEYQRDSLYLVVDGLGRKPNREHRGRAPPFVRIRQPSEAR